MHYIDIIILVIIIASAVEGGFHGFVYEVCSLFGLIAGFVLALQFFSEVAAYLTFIPLPLWILKIVSFLVILIATNVLFRLLGKGLRSLLRKIFMGWLDRIVGAVFGLIRGAFVVVLITMILLLTPLRSVLKKQAPDTDFLKPSIDLVKPLMEMLLDKRPSLPESI